MSNRRSPPVRRAQSHQDISRQQLDLWGEPVKSIESEKAEAVAEKSPEVVAVKPQYKKENTRHFIHRTKRQENPSRSVKVTVSHRPEHYALPSGSPPALTRRQHHILDHLRRREDRGGVPPSLSELCAELGVVSRGSLHKQIAALVEAGLVEAMNGKHRGVRLSRALTGNARHIPLVGAIAAGRPIEALSRDDQVAIPDWMYPSDNCYALNVRGDSMRDIGILNGDVIIVEPRETARNGEVVVALIDGVEATLKRIEQVPGEVRLYAENPEHAPQRYRPDQVRIQGVLVAAMRRYFR